MSRATVRYVEERDAFAREAVRERGGAS
jgi:hypothetical protein